MHGNPSKVVCLYRPQLSPIRALFTLWIPAQKWLFLLSLIFHPLNGFQNPNKHSETLEHIKIHHSGSKEHQIWAFGTFLALKMAITITRNGPENRNFVFFQSPSTFFAYHCPENSWKWISASEYLSGGTSITISGHWKQFLALKMTISDFLDHF